MLKARSRKAVAGRRSKAPEERRTVPRIVRSAGQSVVIGQLLRWDENGPIVDFEGNPAGPVMARAVGSAPQVRYVPGGPDRHEVVLLIDGRSNRPPVLLGILQPLDALRGNAPMEAHVDGRRVEIEGRDEIILRCGEASITLRKNGRVLIRGIEVETRAAGVNRIKGGSVSIN